MIQLKAYTDATKTEQYWIDLYDESPIKLNFSIEDITSAEAKSVFSRTFRVPGTASNNKFFKFAFEIGATDYDVTIKKPAEILVDGNEFRQGHIRLQKVYRNEKLDRYDYELLFLGETRDFSSALGSSTMCDLDLSNLSHQLTAGNVTTSWSAYPSDVNAAGTPITPSFTNGLALLAPDGVTATYGDVIYPLVDFGNDGAVTNLNPRIAIGASHDFTNHDLPLVRLKPMVRAKAVLDAIFWNTEYSYEPGGFLDSDTFKQVYITAWGDEASASQVEGASSNIFSATGDGTDQQDNDVLLCDFEVSDPGANYNPSTYIYTVPEPGTYTFFASLYYSASQLSTGDRPEAAAALEYRIGAGAWINWASGPMVNYATSSVTADITFTAAQLAAGTVQVRGFAERQDGALNQQYQDLHFACTKAPGDVNVSAQFDCTYQQIDFVRDLLTTFRLVMATKREQPNVFIIEPWVDYVATGDVYDWSSKLDRSQDVIVEPVFDTQTDEIEFRHEQDEDYINKYHFDAYKEPYGYLKFDSANELLVGTREIKTNWSPTPVARIEGGATDDHFIIPQVHTHNEAGDHLPVKPKTRFLFYNGLQDTDGHSWRLAGGGTYSLYPLVSNSNVWPMTNNGIVLNWFNDIGYWGTGVPGYPTQLGSSMYTRYWSGYIQSLYNKDARRMSATFILDSRDLQDFSFDDVVFVDGHYWRPEKIIDAPIGEPNRVKVQLIKLLSYSAPTV